MVDIQTIISNGLNTAYTSFKEVVPVEYQPFFSIAFLTVVITLYVLFVYRFYKLIAKRDLIELNLRQYNNFDHLFLKKVIGLILFLIEYIIILPIMVFFWFLVVSLILLMIAKEQSINQIILISACLVGVIRITSYYSQELSQDISKLYPLTILIISVSSSGFFDVGSIIQKVADVGDFFTNIVIYLVFIILVEFVMRVIYIITKLEKVS